jgi:hypothetical protein
MWVIIIIILPLYKYFLTFIPKTVGYLLLNSYLVEYSDVNVTVLRIETMLQHIAHFMPQNQNNMCVCVCGLLLFYPYKNIFYLSYLKLNSFLVVNGWKKRTKKVQNYIKSKCFTIKS